MKKNLIASLSVATVGSFTFSLINSPAQAATMQFDNRIDFANATTSLTVETFNSFTSDVPLPDVADSADGLDIGAFFLSQNPLNNTSRIESNGFETYNIDGTPYINGIGSPSDSITFLFKESITAFGVDLSGVNNNGNRTQVIIGSETFAPSITFGSLQKSFFGVISDTPFTTVTFSAIRLEIAGFDNVSFGQAQPDVAAVPESGFTVALLALGALGLFKAKSKGIRG